ncbi:S9 family peptidase [Flavobacteriales bacterium]|nr:S9 family peptidase [Flavobacteriales bacterium]
MKKILYLSLVLIFSCNIGEDLNQKYIDVTAKKIPKINIYHTDTIIDNYDWMRLSDSQKESKKSDAQTLDVLNYLNAENDFLEKEMSGTESFQNDLFDEFVARIEQNDESVPVSYNGYTYYTKYKEGEDYSIHYRKKNNDSSEEEIILNLPEMAKGSSYFALGDKSISESNNLMAYSVDLLSRRDYTIHIKDLRTGEILADKIQNTTGRITWANDNKTLFYTKKDKVTLRSYQIYRHIIGTDPSEDVLVFEEDDETFGCFIYKTKSRKYLMIGSYQTLSSEYRFLDANDPLGDWQVIQPRENNLEYSVSHFEDKFYIKTNWDAKNFRLMQTSIYSTSKNYWQEVIPHRKDVLLRSIDIFKNYLVVNERNEGLRKTRVINWQDNSEYYITFNDPSYSLYSSSNLEFDTDLFRFVYTSLTTPRSVYDFNMVSKERTLLKQKQVLGGDFDSDNYVSERIFANSRDGKTQIPISLVYRKGLQKNGANPLLLNGYGSYGSSSDPYFSSVRLSLLDRGFTYAIAHVRGGQEMGRDWYEDGKLLKKKNTFYDFIDCAKHLIDTKFTSSEHIYATGGSAGGLLMGAVINMEPELFKGVVAGVPFVDVINTMWDESIPLTTGEFDEWGNPKEKEYYDYMKSYSPYDNIENINYPNLLITTGYWDSQVQYWEPAKWIAKIRDIRANDNLLLMHCNMDVGHGGSSGRFESLKEIALEYAFLFKLENIKN